MSSPTVRPELSEHQISAIKSSAEVKFYRACVSQLNSRYLILHSIFWVHKTISGEPRDGEADFVIFDPDSGFVVIEIKGGGILHDAKKDTWSSEDREGNRHSIKNPFRQAQSEKHVILNKILTHKEWAKYINGQIMAAHAVFFTDLSNLGNIELPQGPKEILGFSDDLDNLQAWVDKIFTYWKGQTNKYQPLGKVGISIINDLFCRDIYVKPLIKFELEEEEKVRIKLTGQQARILTMLGDRKKAVICGGAGTGKTLLALQRARELAKSGKKTLILCYNDLLGDWLSKSVANDENLKASSYHKLCKEQIDKVKQKMNRDLLREALESYPNGDKWDILMPFALACSTEILDEKFDAIIIDEGQDFKEEFWLGITMLFANSTEGYFYIFYDNNQSIYHKPTSLPIKEPPFYLTVNCRNTEEIHNFSYHFYEGEPVDPPIIQGKLIEFISATNIEAQATKIHALILNLLQKESVDSSQFVVLIEGKESKAIYSVLTSKQLPKPFTWRVPRGNALDNQVVIETIYRFKGLESDIVILWGIDNLDKETDREIFYVASSRAKSRLFVVATEATCNYVKTFN